jgi:hypothetical protein
MLPSAGYRLPGGERVFARGYVFFKNRISISKSEMLAVTKRKRVNLRKENDHLPLPKKMIRRV